MNKELKVLFGLIIVFVIGFSIGYTTKSSNKDRINIIEDLLINFDDLSQSEYKNSIPAYLHNQFREDMTIKELKYIYFTYQPQSTWALSLELEYLCGD